MPRLRPGKPTSTRWLPPVFAACRDKHLPAAPAAKPPGFCVAAPEVLPVRAACRAGATFHSKTTSLVSGSCPLPPSSSPDRSDDEQNTPAPAENRCRARWNQTAQSRETPQPAPAGRTPPGPSPCTRLQISETRDTASPPCNTGPANEGTQSRPQSPCVGRNLLPTWCSQNPRGRRRKAPPRVRTAKQRRRWRDVPDGARCGETARKSYPDRCQKPPP